MHNVVVVEVAAGTVAGVVLLDLGLGQGVDREGADGSDIGQRERAARLGDLLE